MNNYIIAPQGGGKTTLAQKIIAAHFGVDTIHRTPVRDLLILRGDSVSLTSARLLTATVVAARVSVVWFDDIDFTADKLALCVAALKEARKQTGRAILAVFCIQEEEVDGDTFIKLVRKDLGRADNYTKPL